MKNSRILIGLLAIFSTNMLLASSGFINTLSKKFEEMVLDPAIQDEFYLGYEIIELDPIGYSDIPTGTEVLNYEIQKWEGINNLRFTTHTFDYRITVESIISMIFDDSRRQSAPRFCQNFLELGMNTLSDLETREACKVLTYDLLYSLTDDNDRLSPISYSIAIDGDAQGDYRLVSIYVRSFVQPEIFARMTFDVFHEI